MTTADAFAAAKINLALHVTGQRSDGYHLLDSLVMFADVGDRLWVTLADTMALRVTGPRAAGVPSDGRNLCWRAAEHAGTSASITLEKHLPAAAGIGGGSSDAAAVLRALAQLTERPTTPEAARLGADVPVCLHGKGCIMRGIGDQIEPLSLPALPCVLVNPGVEISTPTAFKALTNKQNSPLEPLPKTLDAESFMEWLGRQRNDLEPPARSLAPEVTTVLAHLDTALLARMSGSGATCFGLFETIEDAQDAAQNIAADRPDWWVSACTLS